MTQAILPIFLARGESGAGDIINVGSIAGREPYPGGSIYCATKAAVRSFTSSLRKELIASRVRVIEIDPGQVETEFSVVRFYGDKSAADKVYEGCEPLTPEDIAEVVVFAAGRRENVVVADTLVFPNHQVCVSFHSLFFFPFSLSFSLFPSLRFLFFSPFSLSSSSFPSSSLPFIPLLHLLLVAKRKKERKIADVFISVSSQKRPLQQSCTKRLDSCDPPSLPFLKLYIP
jgi:hypothetical protein